ncbi:MAG: lytic transglycosylase domain-containing protein [Gammaproteobacteria bacterium]|nr:lytic transglycosylase domain-containing protein [Gammaproteobacteria bacterium]
MRISGRPTTCKRAVALGLFALLCFAGPARAEVYVYEMPDGSRVITDHPINAKNSRVVRVTPDVKGAGKLAAQKNSPAFRKSPDTYDRLIRQYAKEYDVDFALVKAIMHAESSFNPYAISHKGARGLMQMMPQTAAQYGVRDIFNPTENIRAAIKHLRYLFETFDHRPVLVIAAYNAGENAVKQHRGIPPYKETLDYVNKVLHYKKQYNPNYRLYRVSSTGR